MLFLDLPPEIVILILIRLPVQTLLILKCVSKYFSRFVSSPDFIRMHLKFSTEDASMFRYNVIVNTIKTYNSYSTLEQTSIESLCCQPLPNLAYLEYPKLLIQKVRPVGSCNGLVFIMVDKKNWMICNPTIRKKTKLPCIERLENFCHLDVVRKNCRRYYYYGFGFDASNDDYKVVELCGINRPTKRDFHYVVNVYSLKRNSWIRIPDFIAGEFCEASGMFANGKLHWSTKNRGIVSFDVEKEVFGTLELPNYKKPFFNPLVSVISESITVCCNYDSHFDVWVMKEYGIKESWTKMFTLSDVDFLTEACSILPNGELLLFAGSICIYNPKDNSCRSTDIRYSHIPLICVESLVPPC